MTAELAPAKINLYLHLLARREDGYHDLDSLIVFADAGDDLEALPAETLSLEILGPFAAELSAGADNLVWRAAAALREAGGIAAGAKLRLTKNLPIASGIGGGSSDAAAALRALMALWDFRPDLARLDILARRLGADLPACLYGRACRIGGIGDRLAPAADLPRFALLLVNPRQETPTPAVYRAFRGPFSPPANWPERIADLDHLIAFLATTKNDLAEAAMTISPAIGEVLAALAATPACRLARLSGSGATCFGLYADLAAAEAARSAILARHPDWWTLAADKIG